MVYYDNNSIVLLASNLVLYSHSKHFELDLHYIRDHVTQGLVQISHIPAYVQVAYVLTKAIFSKLFF